MTVNELCCIDDGHLRDEAEALLDLVSRVPEDELDVTFHIPDDRGNDDCCVEYWVEHHYSEERYKLVFNPKTDMITLHSYLYPAMTGKQHGEWSEGMVCSRTSTVVTQAVFMVLAWAGETVWKRAAR